MKTDREIYTSRRAVAVLIAEKTVTSLCFAPLICLFGPGNKGAAWLVSIFFVCQCLAAGAYIHWFVKPLRQLERISDMIGEGQDASDRGCLNRMSSLGGRTGINRLIACVKKAIQNEYDSQMLKSRAEIHALQSQINPHFLYNTLEIIRGQAVACGSDEIAEMTEALATLFRYSISGPGKMATFEEELTNVKNYLLIQHYRFPGKFRFEQFIEEEELLQYRLPVLTIQPIVENAIHHGLETRLGQGVVSIRAFSTGQKFVIRICDDGSGMSEEQLEKLQDRLKHDDDIGAAGEEDGKRAGIALVNVNQRIRFYFGAESGLEVRSTLGVGTIVEITLPVTEREKVGIHERRADTD